MHTSLDNSDQSPRELAELSALADGTLDPRRRAEVEARIAASPELTALYERERRVVELVREAAPPSVRRRRCARGSRPPAQLGPCVRAGGRCMAARSPARWRRSVLALVLALPGGAPGAPSVSQAAGLAMLGAAGAAPAGADGAEQARDEDRGHVLPQLGSRLHWHAIGQRTDHINGRVAVTVYYRAGAKKVAYTIVGAPVLSDPPAGTDDAKRRRVPHAEAERPPRRDVAACGAHLRAVGQRDVRRRTAAAGSLGGVVAPAHAVADL